MRPTTFVLVLAAVAAAATAQDLPSPSVGGHSPHLEVGTWLDGKPPFELYKDRAAMVVFWSSWCGPCTAQFPKLNELVAAMKDKPITFVSIANEPKPKVEAVLGEHALRTRIALDDDGKTFFAFGVRTLPRIVLVDGKGKVAALPRLEDVDAATLERLCAGEEVYLPTVKDEPADLQWDEDEEGFDARKSLAHVLIEPSGAASGGVRFPRDHGRITADGVTFASLVQLAYAAEPHAVASRCPEYSNFARRYRVSVKAADDRAETARTMLQEHLARLFTCRAEWAEVEEPALVLRRVPGRELQHLVPSKAAQTSGTARRGAITWQKVPFERIVAAFGTFGFGQTVVDETGLSGEYDAAIEWTPGDQKALAAALDACGLRCDSEARKVRKLQLSPRRP